MRMPVLDMEIWEDWLFDLLDCMQQFERVDRESSHPTDQHQALFELNLCRCTLHMASEGAVASGSSAATVALERWSAEAAS
jgi:hypothetical protein